MKVVSLTEFKNPQNKHGKKLEGLKNEQIVTYWQNKGAKFSPPLVKFLDSKKIPYNKDHCMGFGIRTSY